MEALGASHDRVQRALSQDFQAQVARFVTVGAIVFPSIFTEFELSSTHSIYLDTFGFIYRFVDTMCDRVFYIVLTGHRCILSCVLISDPVGDIALCRDQDQFGHAAQIFSGAFRTGLIEHICAVGAMFITYLQGAPETFANVQRCEARHMGHMLWNELTGIMKLVEQVPADRLPLCFIPNPVGGELYGPVDQIFPELKGKVDRSIPDAGAFVRHVYQNGLCIIRSTSLIVTQSLRDHILTYVKSLGEFAADRQQIEALRDGGTHIVTT